MILGVWAAFFLQFWMRRREMIATARTVDRFSETMRVLAVRRDADIPTRRVAPEVARGVAREVAPVAARPLRARPPLAVPAPPADAPIIRRPLQEVAMSPRRTLRGIMLVVGFLGTLVFAGLALTGVIQWVGLSVPVAMTLLGYVWLRRGVRQEARARAAARRLAARRGGSRSSVPGASAAGQRVGGAADLEVTEAARVEVVARADVVFDNAPAARRPAEVTSAAFGPGSTVAETEVAPRRRSVRTVDDDDLPLTWEPRAVPLPTYAMKARAERRVFDEPGSRESASAAVAEVEAWDDDLVPLRPRAANG